LLSGNVERFLMQMLIRQHPILQLKNQFLS